MKNEQAQVTEAHLELSRRIQDIAIDHYHEIQRKESPAQLIADSEARAVEAEASKRDTYQREAYHLRKDLCEIAAAFNVGVPDGEEAKKRIIAVKAERDQLRTEVERLDREKPWLAEFKQIATEQRERAERAEAELAAIKQGHGELGRYEQLRLKNAELIKELSKERARQDWWQRHCSAGAVWFSNGKWLVHAISEPFDSWGDAIDAAMMGESK